MQEGAEGEEPAAVLPPAPVAPQLSIGAVLGEALAGCRSCALELLDLSGNSLGDEGVSALATGLRGASKLATLYLGGCCTEDAHEAVRETFNLLSHVPMCPYSLTHSLTHLLTYSPTHLLAYLPTYLLT